LHNILSIKKSFPQNGCRKAKTDSYWRILVNRLEESKEKPDRFYVAFRDHRQNFDLPLHEMNKKCNLIWRKSNLIL